MQNQFKDIVVDSLRFLHNEKSAVIYGFVIMPNHIHLIWQIQDGITPQKVQFRFLKYTAQQMKFRLLDSGDHQLEQYRVNAKDRQYQFWERNPLAIELLSEAVLAQKLTYIHNNPVHSKWRLAEYPEEYKYSSARFYYDGIDEFGFLSHYRG